MSQLDQLLATDHRLASTLGIRAPIRSSGSSGPNSGSAVRSSTTAPSRSRGSTGPNGGSTVRSNPTPPIEDRRPIAAPGQLPANKDIELYPACNHCGWHNNIQAVQKLNNLRCFKCGRFAARAKQIAENTRKLGYLDFGERHLRFRIVAKDVRSDDKYRQSWETADSNDSRWNYDATTMMKSVFDFKIGNRPKLGNTMTLISEYDEATTKQKNMDGIIMENPNDISLLRLLESAGIGKNPGLPYRGNRSKNPIVSTRSWICCLFPTFQHVFSLSITVPWQRHCFFCQRLSTFDCICLNNALEWAAITMHFSSVAGSTSSLSIFKVSVEH